MLLFINGMDAFDIPLLIGMSKGIFLFSTNIYYSLHVAFPPIMAYFAFSANSDAIALFALHFYQRRFAHAERFAVVSEGAIGRDRLSSGDGVVSFICFSVFSSVAFVLPFLGLLWICFSPLSAAVVARVRELISGQLLQCDPVSTARPGPHQYFHRQRYRYPGRDLCGSVCFIDCSSDRDSRPVSVGFFGVFTPCHPLAGDRRRSHDRFPVVQSPDSAISVDLISATQ